MVDKSIKMNINTIENKKNDNKFINIINYIIISLLLLSLIVYIINISNIICY